MPPKTKYPVKYSTIMKAKDKAYRYHMRLQLVKDAKNLGIKPTARLWRCSKNTVKKWLRRYEANGLQGLKDKSRAPKSCPHKTSEKIEKQVVEIRKKAGFSAKRLKEEFDIPCSHGAIERIIKEHGLTKKRKKKRKRKNDLRAVKAKLKPFEKIQMDIKYLCDIPYYYTQMKLYDLPQFQYTIRDVRTGVAYVCYADRISKTHTCALAQLYLSFLKSKGIDMGKVTLQTDNGTEFDGQQTTTDDRGFVYTVTELMGASHQYIPPGCSNANADVETIHNLIEDEFYDRENYRTMNGFLSKAYTYLLYFNLARKNSYQQWKTPVQRLLEADPKADGSICLLPPVFIDNILPSIQKQNMLKARGGSPLFAAPRLPPGGQHLPGHPETQKKIILQRQMQFYLPVL